MRVTQILERAAQVHPNGVGTRHCGRNHAWPEVVARVRQLAAALTHLGATPGDRVALLALNSDRFLEVIFAVAWAGGVLQPVNLRLAGPEVAHQLADAGARVLVLDDAGAGLIDSIDAAAPFRTAARIFIGDRASPAAVGYQEALRLATPGDPSSRSGDDLAALLYTGGTTGRPKGVMLSHRNLVASAVSAAHAFYEDRDDVCLHVYPLFHAAGLVGALRATVACSCQVFLPRFDALDFLTTVSRDGVTRASMAPTMLRMVLEHPRFDEFDLSSLKRLIYGAGPMPEALVEAAMTRLPMARFVQGYGQTESASAFTSLSETHHTLTSPHLGKIRSAGQVMAGSQLAILDPQGRRLPPDEPGEICVRGDNIMLGYWNQPDETASALAGGWLHTGDVGRIDEDGFLFIVDRLKDMIVTGGENVFTAEVEDALAHHPAVAECAVIGVPDERWGERVHAVVRLREGAAVSEGALIAHTAELIARYKCPKSIEFRIDPLPLSAVGKVLKAVLREPHWRDRRRQVN